MKYEINNDEIGLIALALLELDLNSDCPTVKHKCAELAQNLLWQKEGKDE
jgi:hypothetical protein